MKKLYYFQVKEKRDACAQVCQDTKPKIFIIALFITAQIWKDMRIENEIALFLPGCIRIDCHHESNSHYPDQAVQDQMTTSLETNGHRCLSRWEGNST